MSRFYANGFPPDPSRYSGAFVAVGPEFSCGPKKDSRTDTCHVSVALMMSPSDARALADDLLAAADVAEAKDEGDAIDAATHRVEQSTPEE